MGTQTYEIEQPLGRGDMSEAWLARHLGIAGKQVAIKVIKRPGDGHLAMPARFKCEAEIAARSEHPNMAQVLLLRCSAAHRSPTW